MQFEFTPPQTPLEEMFGGHYAINAFGPINESDDERFVEFLAKSEVPPRTPVYINSVGGHVEAAMSIGRAIRGAWFSTNIGSNLLGSPKLDGMATERVYAPGKCMSAATLMYLGGRLRYFSPGSDFGVHQFSFRDPLPDHISRSQILSAKIASYLPEMGITVEFLQLTSAVESSTIELIAEAELQRLSVVTGGETPVDWTIQAANNALYVRGERDSIYGHHKVMIGKIAGGGFYFHAVIESQGRQRELLGFTLVEITLWNEDIGIDISERCSRNVVGIYVNVFCFLSDDEAKLLAFSDGFGVQIRAASDAGMFLGIAPMSTDIGQTVIHSFINALLGHSPTTK